MKKADKPYIIVVGNNNKVYYSTASSVKLAVTIALSVIIVVAVLTVAFCCPDLFADFVRWIISKLISN